MNAHRDRRGDISHPLVVAYLEDLARELDGTEQEGEVLESVREHIADALTATSNPNDSASVRAVLKELGPVERIAASQEVAESRPEHVRSTVLLVLAVIAVASAGFVLPLPFVAVPVAVATLVIGIVALTRRWQPRPAAWVTVIASTLALLIAVVGALTVLRWGPTEFSSQQGEPTPVVTLSE